MARRSASFSTSILLASSQEPPSALQDRSPQWARLPCGPIDVDAGQVGGGGDVLRLDVDHLVLEPYHLLAHLQQPGADQDDVPGDDFSLVEDVLLDRDHASVGIAE